MTGTMILKGNILHAEAIGELTCLPGGYLAAEEGKILGVYPELPGKYANLPVHDHGDCLIVPAFSDLHLHAPQYCMMGLGMDLPLLEWLNTYTFQLEAAFSDTAFARQVYRRLADELIAQGTTRVCIFSSIHRESTIVLMEELERAGVTGFVGKVNMDRNSRPNLTESTEESLRETLTFLEEAKRFPRLKPILTPRFTPSCTDRLMERLGKAARKYDLPVQSHLSESKAEIDWVKELHPDCAYYYETYEKYGLWKPGTLMAHCVHSDRVERAAMKAAGVTAVHCPDSNTNIVSGVAPVRRMLNEGVSVALGSDIAGGAELSMLSVAANAIRASKLRNYFYPEDRFLTVKEAFYLATSAGQLYFGEKPGFAPGNALHAVVLDDAALPPSNRPLTLTERLERLVYLARDREIAAVYSEGIRRK